MTVLSDSSLRVMQPIAPFEETHKVGGMSAGLSHCGYDIKVKQTIVLGRGDFALASAMGRFEMPNNVMGIVHDKSTWARKGLSVFNTVIEPGWCGFLTLELVNHGPDVLVINEGSPIAQVIFHWVDSRVSGYAGKYQDQPDEPVPARFEVAE